MMAKKLCESLKFVLLLHGLFAACRTANALSLSNHGGGPPEKSSLHHHQKRPFVGVVERHVDDCHTQFIIVGTSHYRCQSAEQVKAIIEETQPDAVVVELDPERVVRLTKEYAMTSPDQDFGADFLSAIQVAQDMDIPLFLGDEYVQATQERFLTTLVSPATYNPSSLFSALFPSSDTQKQVDVFQSFLQDPRKAVPLLSSLVLPFLSLLVFALLGGAHHDSPTTTTDSAWIGNNSQVILSITFSALSSAKVFNTLIVDRDQVLAAKALEAAKVTQSLKNHETIRKTWRFLVPDDVDDCGIILSDDNHKNPSDSNTTIDQDDMMPLFTLKTALQANAIRNLNLFEPRWLAMIDGIKDKNDPKFGCITCTNKFYSVIQGPDGREGRYADVIFRRRGRTAKLVHLVEGSRPSGARKVNTQIQGERSEFFLDDASTVEVSKEGYLAVPASNLLALSDNSGDDVVTKKGAGAGTKASQTTAKVVVVVGLLHANGVIDLLREK